MLYTIYSAFNFSFASSCSCTFAASTSRVPDRGETPQWQRARNLAPTFVALPVPPLRIRVRDDRTKDLALLTAGSRRGADLEGVTVYPFRPTADNPDREPRAPGRTPQ